MALFPSSVQFANMTITSMEPNQVSVTHSLKRQVRSRGGQRWAIKGDFPPMTREQAGEVYAFSVAQKGQYEVFTFVPATTVAPIGTANGSPLCVGAHAAGSMSISTDGWDASQAGALKPGDYIKFAHDKVYMVLNTVASDTGGAAALQIHPALVVALADNEQITTHNIPFTVAFASDQRDLAAANSGMYGMDLSLVEVV